MYGSSARKFSNQAGVIHLVVQMAVTELSWLPAAGDDEEFASPPSAARPLQPIARAAGNALLARMSDWGLTPEGHSGTWQGPNPEQLSLPLLTGMRTLQATPAESSKAASGSRFLLYAHVACPLAALDLTD